LSKIFCKSLSKTFPMIKNFLLILAAIFINQIGNGQSSVNFNCDDCASIHHDLFTELDSGKVVVITWVMPCVSCIPVASTAANAVLTFATSNPGKVKFYLADDYANTNCSSLSGWANTNSIITNANFSNSALSIDDYGGIGANMQKTVVLGGGNCHRVFYNKNGSITQASIEFAINNALGPCDGIFDNNNKNFSLKVFPNPAENYVQVDYQLAESDDVQIDIMNTLGEKMQSISLGKKSLGTENYRINVEMLNAGAYFIRLSSGKNVEFAKFLKI